MKLSKDELARCHQIVMDVWNAIAPDIDTIEGDIDNLKVVALCMDYVDMYAYKPKESMAFMRSLFDRVGFEQVCEEIAENYCYY